MQAGTAFALQCWTEELARAFALGHVPGASSSPHARIALPFAGQQTLCHPPLEWHSIASLSYLAGVSWLEPPQLVQKLPSSPVPMLPR